MLIPRENWRNTREKKARGCSDDTHSLRHRDLLRGTGVTLRLRLESDVEAEVDHVAIAHDVLLTFRR